jgi:hypothetical protein
VNDFVFYILMIFLILGDFVTTYYGIEYLNCVEQNNFLSLVVNNHAWHLLFVIKVLEIGFLYMLFDVIKKVNKKRTILNKLIVNFFQASVIFLLSVVVFNNLFFIWFG